MSKMSYPDFEPGSVWLVGAGPGAPELLTLLAHEGLKKADIIFYDALVNPAILDLANPKAEKIYAGKRGGRASAQQEDISLRLIQEARKGFRVLRLKGGDPCIFGRGGEEGIALRHAAIPFRLVPGISAGIGGLAYAGIPVTHRETNHSVLFLTGHKAKEGAQCVHDWAAIAKAAPVLVIYMALTQLEQIAEELMRQGRRADEPLALISNASLPEQEVRETTLGGAASMLQGNKIKTPAIAVIGPVVSLRDQLDWFVCQAKENFDDQD